MRGYLNFKMLLIANFKNYKKGKNALKLAKLIQKYNKQALVGVQFQDIKLVSSNTNLKVYSQQLTKEFNAKKVKFLGAHGTFLNHSAYKLGLNDIKKLNNKSKQAGLKVIVFAANLNEVKQIKKLKPNYIAYEDPKLIGTGKSITKYKGKNVEKFVRLLKGTKIIPVCGAGISSIDDVKQAKKLGCKGVAIASAIANVKEKEAEEFLKEIKSFNE